MQYKMVHFVLVQPDIGTKLTFQLLPRDLGHELDLDVPHFRRPGRHMVSWIVTKQSYLYLLINSASFDTNPVIERAWVCPGGANL